MRPGEIVVDRASRRFRVHPQPVRTLKEALALPERRQGDRGLGAPRRLARGRARRGGRPDRPQRLRQDDAAPPRSPGSSSRPRAASRPAAASPRCSSSAPASTPTSPGRENVYLNGSIYGLKRAHDPRADGRDRRLRRARAVHRHARAHLLVAACTCGSASRSPRTSTPTSSCSTRCSPSATRSSSASASRRSSSSSSAAERSSSSRTTPPRSSASASARCCCATASVELDGSTQEAIARYHKLLADERDPEESAAGLREYGSGEARIVEARLLGPEGEERQQLARRRAAHRRAADRRPRGAPAAAHLARAPRRGRPPARRRGAGHAPSSAGARQPGERVLRFDVERPPLADGRFRLRFELGDRDGPPPLPLAGRRGPVRRLPGGAGARARPARRAAGRCDETGGR